LRTVDDSEGEGEEAVEEATDDDEEVLLEERKPLR